MKKYIENMLDADWRKIIGCRFSGNKGLLCHPQIMPDVYLERAKQMAKELDFKTEGKASSYKAMTKLPDFNGNCRDLRDNIIKGKGNDYLLYYDNGKKTRSQMSVMEYFKSIYNKNEIEWYNLLYDWAGSIGIYPLDIAYISHIAFDNSRHILVEKVPEFSYSEQKEDGILKSICLEWAYGAHPKNPENIFNEKSKLYRKFREASSNKRVLYDEGFSDIIKIVLWRYYGIVELRAGKYCIRAEHGNEETYLNDKESDVIDHTALKITISEPPKME
jgi:hypothetical protein